MESESSDNHSQEKRPESTKDAARLKLFLRQAVAIIAAERGLNAQSRLKLESLAKHQKLSDRLFDEAIRKLQEKDYRPKKLLRYERAFEKFLAREFKKLKGGVLSVSKEQNAIDLAGTKYQIPPHRAEKLIAEQAKIASIGRIARSEAETYATQLIAERIGARKELDEELHTELVNSASKLGLPRERVDQEILRILTINRKPIKSDNHMPILATIGCLCLIGLIALGVCIYTEVVSVPWFSTATTNPPVEVVSDVPEIVDIERPALPSWVSRKSEGLVEGLLSLPRTSGIDHELFDENPQTRKKAYRRLVDLTLGSEFKNRKPFEDAVCDLFYREPELDAVAEIVDRVGESARLPSGQISTMKTIEKQDEAIRLLGLMYFHPISEPGLGVDVDQRRSDLSDQIRLMANVNPTDILFTEYLQQSDSGLAVDQWNHLINNCWSAPGRTATLVQPLFDSTRGKLVPKSINNFRLRLLHSILELDASQWTYLKRPIKESISACDEVELIEWIEIFQNSPNAEFKRFAGELLVRKADLQIDTRNFANVVNGLADYALVYRNRILRPLLHQNEQIEVATVRMLEGLKATNRQTDADLIARIEFLTNINLALCQKIRLGQVTQVEDFSVIEESLANSKVRLRDLVSLPGSVKSRSKAIVATAYDFNRKKSLLQKISDSSPLNMNSRIKAIEQLETSAARFDDLPYDEANLLATYIFSNLREREFLNIQGRLRSFRDWPTLGIAIADQIGERELPLDTVLTVTRLYFERDFEIEANDKNWGVKLQNQILAHLSERLGAQIGRDTNSAQSDWSRLEIYLLDLYRERFELIFTQQEAALAQIRSLSQPAEVLLSIIEQRLQNVNEPLSQSARLQRGAALIQREPFNKLEKTIMANQLVFEMLSANESRTMQENADRLRRLADEVDTMFEKSSVLSEKLLAISKGTLELASLKRQEMVEELLLQK